MEIWKGCMRPLIVIFSGLCLGAALHAAAVTRPSAASPADLFFGSDGLRAPLPVLEAEADRPKAYLRPGGVQVAARVWDVPAAAAAAFPGGMVAAYALDLDSDGKEDWLAVEQGSQAMRVVRSDGSMGAVVQHHADPCPCTRSFADLDGDGWVEMLVACEGIQRWTVQRLDRHLDFGAAFRFRPGFVKDGAAEALPGMALGAPVLEGVGKQRRVLGLAKTNNFAEDDESFAPEALPTLYFHSATKGESLERLKAAQRAQPISLAELARSRDELRWRDGLAHPLESRRLAEGSGWSLEADLVQLGSNSDPWPDPPVEAVVARKAGVVAWHAPLDPGSPCCRSANLRRGFLQPGGAEAALVLESPAGLQLRRYNATGLLSERTVEPCLLLGGQLQWGAGELRVQCAQTGIPEPGAKP